jgi:hypothetical protein
MSLSMTIDGYTEFQDIDMDERYEYGQCETCHGADTDSWRCRCQNVKEDMERWDTSEYGAYFIYRTQAEAQNRSRLMRQLKRKCLRNIALWQRVARMNGIVNYWSKATFAPDSKAFHATAKRFRGMQADEEAKQRQ